MPSHGFNRTSKSSRGNSLPQPNPSEGRIETGIADQAKKRWPLKRKPLRNPGESLQEEIHLIKTEQLIPPVMIAGLAVWVAAVEWWRHLREVPPQPLLYSMMALAAISYGGYKWVILRKRMRLLKLGMDGEKAVGQFLEALRSQGCRVFHDIVGNGFNIDHVVIGPRGVFTVETKTFSKPGRGRATAEYDEEKILLNGVAPDRNPIAQARAARDWLRDLFLETTARKFPVKGVVVLPGWYVKSRAECRPDVWVLNPKALPSFIEHEPAVLKEEDIALASSRLINYVTR